MHAATRQCGEQEEGRAVKMIHVVMAVPLLMKVVWAWPEHSFFSTHTACTPFRIGKYAAVL